MLCIWSDQKSFLYYEFLKPKETMTGEMYRLQLMRLSRALKDKRPEYEDRYDKVILHMTMLVHMLHKWSKPTWKR